MLESAEKRSERLLCFVVVVIVVVVVVVVVVCALLSHIGGVFVFVTLRLWASFINKQLALLATEG